MNKQHHEYINNQTDLQLLLSESWYLIPGGEQKPQQKKEEETMMNMYYTPAMNNMLSEDVNVPALRNPLNHVGGKRREEKTRREKKGWIDAIQALRRER